ncbi:caspase-like protein [Leptotrombidium deliense]|uniref:Caspase-like protein n=1 Tax=Leptotrombidium deliense TaxID=299467 RepID=A0A443SCH9_9ACAR|nr:caspase-like protein [Leptotrombidium deliense]
MCADTAFTKRQLFDSDSPSSPFSEEEEDETFTAASGETGYIRPLYKFKKGLCLIFNHEDFDIIQADGNKLNSRFGTEIDKNAIVSFFQEIGFIVPEPFQDMKVDEIKQTLLKYARNEDKLDYDLLACFILTHGNRDQLCAKDNRYPSIMLYEPFLPQNCELLKDKPKLFFLNACQGEGYDGGFKFDACDVPIDTPEDDDFFVSMSSVPGFKSWRSSATGSFYIESLIRTLRKSRIENPHEDINSIITTVQREIASKVEISSKQIRNMTEEERKKYPIIKQMPIFFSTLRDDLALNAEH